MQTYQALKHKEKFIKPKYSDWSYFWTSAVTLGVVSCLTSIYSDTAGKWSDDFQIYIQKYSDGIKKGDFDPLNFISNCFYIFGYMPVAFVILAHHVVFDKLNSFFL
jgi:hypothetical protein